jgi:thiol:disulfide interchange protein DsbD
VAGPESKGIHSGNITASLLSDAAAVKPGDSIRVGLRLKPDKGWHTYWRNAGDAGFAPSVEWTLPAGVKASELDWPVPHVNHGPITSHDYPGEVIHVTTISVPASYTGKTLTIKAAASWLACKESCVPGDATLTIDLPISKKTIRNLVGAVTFNRRAMPSAMPKGWAVSAKGDAKQLTLTLSTTVPLPAKAHLLLTAEGIIEASAPQRWSRKGTVHTLQLKRGPNELPDALEALLVLPDGSAHTLDITL